MFPLSDEENLCFALTRDAPLSFVYLLTVPSINNALSRSDASSSANEVEQFFRRLDTSISGDTSETTARVAGISKSSVHGTLVVGGVFFSSHLRMQMTVAPKI